ncbi:hypothetical protein [uncultured Microscilla sp.]|uniref:hypothetical protein n=1 Tax=uncultured Microscilla sp. TaxID=432653 RepID=UPI0026117A6C|nr:hypothetical protein [uncultured Microscilla sp.]
MVFYKKRLISILSRKYRGKDKVREEESLKKKISPSFFGVVDKKKGLVAHDTERWFI